LGCYGGEDVARETQRTPRRSLQGKYVNESCRNGSALNWHGIESIGSENCTYNYFASLIFPSLFFHVILCQHFLMLQCAARCEHKLTCCTVVPCSINRQACGALIRKHGVSFLLQVHYLLTHFTNAASIHDSRFFF